TAFPGLDTRGRTLDVFRPPRRRSVRRGAIRYKGESAFMRLQIQPLSVGLALVFLAGTSLQPFSPGRTMAPAPVLAANVVEVKMVTTPDGASGTFKPANVTVKKGDILRFLTDGRTVHNVSFPPSENPGKANLPSLGPYLTTPGTS